MAGMTGHTSVAEWQWRGAHVQDAQRPATANGLVFLSLEDETGIANVIVTPYVFGRVRPVLAGEPFLLIEGTLQYQDGVVSVRAERMAPLTVVEVAEVSHRFSLKNELNLLVQWKLRRLIHAETESERLPRHGRGLGAGAARRGAGAAQHSVHHGG